MAKKNAIEAQITAMLTGNASRTSRANHEAVLKQNVNSILENIYMTPITEKSSATLTITTSNVNFSYKLVFTKTGRTINVNGIVTNISGVTKFNGEVMLSFSNDEYYASSDTTIPTETAIGDLIRIYITDSGNFQLIDTLLDGESIYINTNYNSAE